MNVEDIDLVFLRKAVQARLDVGNWFENRPRVGLDVTDVELLMRGFDYLAYLLKETTGEDIAQPEQLSQAKIQITFGE